MPAVQHVALLLLTPDLLSADLGGLLSARRAPRSMSSHLPLRAPLQNNPDMLFPFHPPS